MKKSEPQSTNRVPFADRMLAMANNAATMLMVSLGHRTGLFDLMASMPPATSSEIAQKARLSERYVREWLGNMVTAGIVDYDPAAGTCILPAEHAACLTRAAAPNNLASMAQWFAVLAGVEDHVLRAFRHGRGVPYSAYHRFHEVMAEESDQTVVGALEPHILPLVEGLSDRLREGIDVLDVGCGSGRAVCQLARMFPASRFTGIDLCSEAIGAARRSAAAMGLTNVCFEVVDAAEPGPAAAYDLITAFNAIHDQARPALVLGLIARMLRPGGTFLMQDVAASSHLESNRSHPLGPFLYGFSTMHCLSVSLACGGTGLGAVWGKELALQMLADAGFGDVRVEQLPHDPINYYYIATR
jgi:SAM-dependent methyltransferase